MARLKGRWGFILVGLAVLLWTGRYYYTVQIKNHGLRLPDSKGEKVYVISPEERAETVRDIATTIWVNARQYPQLLDARLPIYLNRQSVVDQFDRDPVMDIGLGEIHLLEAWIDQFRRTDSLAAALEQWRDFYLDWPAEQDRRLDHLIDLETVSDCLPGQRNWLASLNWVLFNMLPRPEFEQVSRQSFDHLWAEDPHLVKVDPNIAWSENRGYVGGCPGKGELTYRLDYSGPGRSGAGLGLARIRDVHTTWNWSERLSLFFSTDGRTWTPIYSEAGWEKTRLFAVDLDAEIAGANRLYLKYVFDVPPSGRSRDDNRGARLHYLEVSLKGRESN